MSCMWAGSIALGAFRLLVIHFVFSDQQLLVSMHINVDHSLGEATHRTFAVPATHNAATPVPKSKMCARPSALLQLEVHQSFICHAAVGPLTESNKLR